MAQAFQILFDAASIWGNEALITAMVVTLIGCLWYWRQHPDLPTSARLTRTATSWWALFFVLAGVGLYLINVRMAPMTGALATLQEARGQKVPSITFRRLADSEPMKLEDFRGQVVVLNLWATWCPPCRKEMPDLDRLHRTYRDQGLAVIALSDESPERLQKFFDGIPVELVAAYTERYNWLLIDTFRPLTLVIDRQGVLRTHLLGARSFENFEKNVQPYL